LETFFLGKRTPQYPGSIRSDSSMLLLRRIVDGRGMNPNDAHAADVDEEILLKALEVRRKVTLEIFKEAMGRGKFGITYTENLVSQIPEFIDYVMIKAVSLKESPEFSESSFNIRALAAIDESGVVPLIRWLKHNSLSYPQIGKLIVKSGGNLNPIRNLAEWLKSVHVKGRFIGTALTRAGESVLRRDTEDLNELVEYLEENGVKRDWMGCIISRCPEILTFTMEELRIRTEFYLNLGIDRNDFGTMLFDCPKAFGYLPVEEMKQKAMYFKDFGLSDEDLGRLLAYKPQLMGCGIEDKLKPLVKYFYYLGISRDGMRRILTMKPILFCIDLETTIVPKVRFLRDIGVAQDAIGNLLVKFPSLMTYSLSKKLRPVVIFLLTEAGVSEESVGKVVASSPELFGCSIAHKLDLNVRYLLSIGITVAELGEMVSDFPMLLRYSIDNVLRPKYRYLRKIMIRPLRDLIDFPSRFFSYSLEDRIIPRHEMTVESRLFFKLERLLNCSDEEFRIRINERVRIRSGIHVG
ncbi:hypothetical protein M569_10626, partial [Genlisea aurea]